MSTDELAVRLADAEEKISQGLVPTWIYNDPELFLLERERLFGRAWVYLAHESEVAEPGSYVVRRIVDASLLIMRGSDGAVRVFLNQCTHRGPELCPFDEGSGMRIRCNYHGWTFNDRGDLVGVPFDKEVYLGIDKDALGLRPIAQHAIRYGFIFGCLDEQAMSIDEYLGDFTFYLEMVTGRSRQGLEVYGAPQRWIVEADWKVAAENLIGDSYHTPFTHRSIFDVGLVPFSTADAAPGGAKTGLHIQVGNADVAMIQRPPGTYMGYPPEVLESLQEQLAPDQWALLDHGAPSGSGTFINRFHLFPNLSSLNVAAFAEEGRLDPYMSLRVWHPIGPGRMEIIAYLMVEADATKEAKDASRRAYLLSFGPSGMAEQDDMENWRMISAAAATNPLGATQQFVRMGAHHREHELHDWPGPGTAYGTQYFDLPAQTFLLRCLQYLREESPNHA